MGEDNGDTHKITGPTSAKYEGEEESNPEGSWQDTEFSERSSAIESDLSPSLSHSCKFGISSSRNSSQLGHKNMTARKEHDCCRRDSTCTDRHSSGQRSALGRQGGSSAASTRSSATPTSRARSRRMFPSFHTRNNLTEHNCLQIHSKYSATSNYITRPFTFSYFKYYSN